MVFSIWALASLPGCGTPPRTNTDAPATKDIPVAWRSQDFALSSDSPDLQRWWTRFNDPLLTQLTERALAGNTGIQGARETLRQAYALRDVSRAALSPMANFSASVQRNFAGGSVVNPGYTGSNSASGGSAANTFANTLSLSWELDVFGARQRAVDASMANAQSSAATLGMVQTAIAQEIAQGYITLRTSQARLRIARQSVDSQTETLQITQWRLQAGLVSNTDVAQARAAQEQTLALLPALQGSIEKMASQLGTLAVLPLADVRSLIEETGSIPMPTPIPTTMQDGILGTPQNSLLHRADVRAAQFQITRSLALLEQARAQNLPTFTVGASVGTNAPRFSAIGDNASALAGLSATIVVPIVDGGAAKAQVRAQEAALQLARSNYQAAVTTALQEVEDALTLLRTDRERLLRLGNAASAATEAANMAQSRYSSGLVDFQTVLETQRNQLATQDSVASATADISTDQINLFKALGGGWQSSSLEENNGAPAALPPLTPAPGLPSLPEPKTP